MSATYDKYCDIMYIYAFCEKILTILDSR